MSLFSWIKREAGSLEAVFHTAVNNIHNELNKLEGLAVTADEKGADLTSKAQALYQSAAEHSALAVAARTAASAVRDVL